MRFLGKLTSGCVAVSMVVVLAACGSSKKSTSSSSGGGSSSGNTIDIYSTCRCRAPSRSRPIRW